MARRLNIPATLDALTINAYLRAIKEKTNGLWAVGQRSALSLFSFSARNVPAYQQFLNEHRLSAAAVRNFSDWSCVPLTDKASYLKRYAYQDLFPDRNVARAGTISATSGSTGEPFYFPRAEEHDRRHDYVFELFLKNQFELEKKKSLVIIGFGLGIWIGGILNYRTFNRLSQRYPLTVAPVGVNKELILTTIKKLGPYYDQIILCGYPPFVKDVADAAGDHGVDWRQYRMRVITAAEGYSEKFRDYLGAAMKLADIVKDTVNIYGTVELGAMAHETPLTNIIRRIAVREKSVFTALFPEANRLPTLAQYHPELIWFEAVNGEVVATGSGSLIPLVRYRFADLGGVITFSEMNQRLRRCGVNLEERAARYGIAEQVVRLPFVYVYGRSDYAVVLRGANIYPEEIKGVLENRMLNRLATGRFTMVKREGRDLNSYLEINIELKRSVGPTADIAELALHNIVSRLRQSNSEFNNEYTASPEKTTPKIILWPYEHPDYFGGAGKQKWITT